MLMVANITAITASVLLSTGDPSAPETRIAPTTEDSAPEATKPILAQLKQAIGMIPNVYATIGHSPGSLASVLAWGDAVGKGGLSKREIEQLNLHVSELNGCGYCVSAHSMLGSRAGLTPGELIENIDIGGPTMVRSAAKNFESVAVVTDPADYNAIAEELKANCKKLSLATRLNLSRKAYAATSRYDGMITTELERLTAAENALSLSPRAPLPERIHIALERRHPAGASQA